MQFVYLLYILLLMMQIPFFSQSTQSKAIDFVKKHKQQLINEFANDAICTSQQDPASLFMAGSPGAGKTEYAVNWLVESKWQAVHIDTDKVRDWIPMYTGANANDIQAAASIGVEKLQDYCLKYNKSFILDATLADYEISKKNIQRSLKKGRLVEIHYLYQDPIIAWEFTKQREKLEGRHVPKDVFINAVFSSYANVQKLKSEFGSDISVTVVQHNYQEGLENYFLGVNTIDKRVKIPFTVEQLHDRIT